MSTLLQINVSCNYGSTGHIAEDIMQRATEKGWRCVMAHGGRYVRPSKFETKQISTKSNNEIHALKSIFFDGQGLGSTVVTRRFIEDIKRLKPDIIHFHNLHGYYLNYRVLFGFLNITDIPIVWTFHDCWAFTGHCAHFVTAGCEKWKTGCSDCPLKGDYPKALMDRSRRNYDLKKKLFTANKNLHIVPVSEWLAGLVKQSFLKDKDITVIHNGVDIDVFHPMPLKSKSQYRIIGVSSVWNKEKGLFDFYKLRELLDKEQYEIVLVGLTKEQVASLPEGITGVVRTSSVKELAEYYSSANVFVNPTYADTFPTVNLEALACGTPVITYRTGGSPESVTRETGAVVEQGNVEAMANAIKVICGDDREKYRRACRERAEENFEKNKCFEKYVKLYEELI